MINAFWILFEHLSNLIIRNIKESIIEVAF
jgi:hypothetical protein